VQVDGFYMPCQIFPVWRADPHHGNLTLVGFQTLSVPVILARILLDLDTLLEPFMATIVQNCAAERTRYCDAISVHSPGVIHAIMLDLVKAYGLKMAKEIAEEAATISLRCCNAIFVLRQSGGLDVHSRDDRALLDILKRGTGVNHAPEPRLEPQGCHFFNEEILGEGGLRDAGAGGNGCGWRVDKVERRTDTSDDFESEDDSMGEFIASDDEPIEYEEGYVPQDDSNGPDASDAETGAGGTEGISTTDDHEDESDGEGCADYRTGIRRRMARGRREAERELQELRNDGGGRFGGPLSYDDDVESGDIEDADF
jgi:hypothetical protein